MSLSELRKVVIAASIGTVFEYYDLLISATAAGIVWPKLYFIPASTDPNVGLALSLSTVGLAFIVRPLGGFIFGHIGDKLGRKSTLLLTLFLMFIGTLGLGVLPTYYQIGVASVYLIILFRIIQGIGFGGEWGGAASWIAEFAKKFNQDPVYWTSILQGAVLFGIASSTIAFSLASLLLPQQDFLNWGWRILFIVGALIVILGGIIRYYTSESPLFIEAQKKGEIAKSPGVETLKIYWKKIILLALSWWYMTVTTVLIATPYSIQLASALGVKGFGLNAQTFMNLVVGIGYISGGLASIALGMIRKRLDFIKTNIIFALLSGFLVYFYLFSILTKDPVLIILASIIFFAVVFYPFGMIAAWFTEGFPTKYRYTGTGLSYQFGGLLSGLTSSLIPPLIVLLTGLSADKVWPYYALTYTIICIVSALSTLIYSKVKTKV